MTNLVVGNHTNLKLAIARISKRVNGDITPQSITWPSDFNYGGSSSSSSSSSASIIVENEQQQPILPQPPSPPSPTSPTSSVLYDNGSIISSSSSSGTFDNSFLLNTNCARTYNNSFDCRLSRFILQIKSFANTSHMNIYSAYENLLKVCVFLWYVFQAHKNEIKRMFEVAGWLEFQDKLLSDIYIRLNCNKKYEKNTAVKAESFLSRLRRCRQKYDFSRIENLNWREMDNNEWLVELNNVIHVPLRRNCTKTNKKKKRIIVIIQKKTLVEQVVLI